MGRRDWREYWWKILRCSDWSAEGGLRLVCWTSVAIGVSGLVIMGLEEGAATRCDCATDGEYCV